MRALVSLRHALLCLVTAAVAGCSDATGPDRGPAPNFVRLQSDNGDYIGGGLTYEYSHANAIIGVTAAGAYLSVSINGDEWWSGDFAGPSQLTRLEPGTYAGLQRYPFHNPATGGLAWGGEGRGCNTLTGSFTVDSVTYVGDSLTTIYLRFEQHCEGGGPALRGTIHWRADDTTSAPGPVRTVPANLWQPPAGSTPAAGDYVYLQSDAGDYIGGGQTSLYTEPTATITAVASGALVTVSVDGWEGRFQGMSTIDQLRPGYYADLSRYPFHNPAKGGLSWDGNGRGCNTLSGWFAVDRATYVGGTLTALELRFEQHCEEGIPALRGKVRWTA